MTDIPSIHDFTDADGRQVQPYFAAFMIERGLKRAAELFEREGHGAEYIRWSNDRWREYRQSLGLGDETPITGRQRAEFAAYLQTRIRAAAEGGEDD